MEKRQKESQEMGPSSHGRKLLSCSVPQFPHSQSRITDMPSSLVHTRIRCASDQEMLRTGPSLWRMLRKWGAKAHSLGCLGQRCAPPRGRASGGLCGAARSAWSLDGLPPGPLGLLAWCKPIWLCDWATSLSGGLGLAQGGLGPAV